MFALFIFIASIFLPFYTYALYPFVLRFLPKIRQRENSSSNYRLKVRVFIISDRIQKSDIKRNELIKSYTKDQLLVTVVNSYKLVSDNISSCNTTANPKNEIIVITDSETVFGENALKKLVQPFHDIKVGLSVGLLKKMPTSNDSPNNSVNWKYENTVRLYESKIGAVSGANHAIFAVRRSVFPTINERIINPDFYIATKVASKGYDCVFTPDAIAYEPIIQDESVIFINHVNDSCGYFQCLFLMFHLQTKHLFVFISHRVLKWFVPLDIALLLVSNVFLAWNNIFFKILLVVQLISHISIICYHILKRKRNNKNHMMVGRIISHIDYFYTLNTAIVLGFIRFITGCGKY